MGSASGPQYDQELENVAVGPVPVGTSKFVLATPPPDPSKIPEDDLLGATVALICCSYKGHEFIRVGYWINNTYGEPVPEGKRLRRQGHATTPDTPDLWPTATSSLSFSGCDAGVTIRWHQTLYLVLACFMRLHIYLPTQVLRFRSQSIPAR